MEIKEQPNQNPEQGSNSTIQEEKPATVAVTIENEEISRESDRVAKLQISDAEKSSIVEMIQGKASGIDSGGEQESTSKISVISENEDVEYATCMTDNPLASKRRLFIRMKKGSPDDALKKAVKYLDDEIKKFWKSFETSKSKK